MFWELLGYSYDQTSLEKHCFFLVFFAPSKRQYHAPYNKIPLKKDAVSFGKRHKIYSSWQLLHDTHTACLEEIMAFLWTDMLILKIQCFIVWSYPLTDRNNILCNHAEYVGNTSLRCTKPVKPIYIYIYLKSATRFSNWPFFLPLVRHHSYKNDP